MSGVEVTVSGGTAPTVNVTGSGPNAVVDGEIVVQIGGGEPASVNVPAASGVTSLNALSGAVTLAVVGGSIAATGNTLTITVDPGVSSWNDLTDKPATFPPSSHGHAISDVTGLQTALDGKQAAGSYAAAVHGHAISDVTGLQTALDGKQAAGSYAAAVHGHAISDVTGLQTALDGKQAAGSYVVTTDGRLTDAREWSAATVTQAEAEAGTATTRVAWTVQRVWQAIAAWWAASSAKSKLDGIATGATANQTDAYLLSRANHTGTQDAGTITGLATVATTGSYTDLSNTPSGSNITSGTAVPTGGADGDIYLQYPPG